MVGGEDLVAGLERDRLCNDVEPAGGVGHRRDVVDRGSELLRHRLAHDLEPLGQAAAGVEELDRLSLELQLPALILLEYRPWAGAERTVVEEGDCGIEQEKIGKIGGQNQRPLRVGSKASRKPSPSSEVDRMVTARASVGNP